MLTIAFIFATEGCSPDKDCAVIRSENITVHIAGVSTYSQAVETAKQMTAKGCQAIELCPAFGNRGVAHVKEAVGENIPVGVVRFDAVPALGGKSGDVLFNDLDQAQANAGAGFAANPGSLKGPAGDLTSGSDNDPDEAVVRKLVDKIVRDLRKA